MRKEVSNLNELGTDLMKVYTELRNGEMEKENAVSLARVAAQVIGTAKVIMTYHSMKNSSKEIKMLEDGSN